MAQIRARERRFYTIAVVVTIIAVLLAGVSVYSMAGKTTPPARPAAQAFDVRASVLGRRLSRNTTSEPFSKPGSSVDVGCEESRSSTVTYDIPASASVTAHNARWDDKDNIKSHEAHSEVRGGTVVASGSITGLDKHVFNCPGGGHATLVVFGTVNRTTDSLEPSQPMSIGSSELARDPITFNAPSDANLRIESFRVEIRPRGQSTPSTAVDVPTADGHARQIEQTEFGTRFRFNASGRTLTISATSD